MNTVYEIANALGGCLRMIGGGGKVVDRFNASSGGLVNAVGFYTLAVVLVMLGMSPIAGVPGPLDVLREIAAHLASLLAIGVALVVLVWTIRAPERFLRLAVPTVYAMALTLILGLPLYALIEVAAMPVALILLAIMFYRIAHDFGGTRIDTAVAFAFLGAGVLVALPLALYMLTVPAAAA